jgi:hypothetical protein
MTTKPPLQKILKGIIHTEDESKKRNLQEDGKYKTTGEERQGIRA